MPRAMFIASTFVLGAASLICWALADWAVSQMYAADAGNLFPFGWLLIAVPAAICFVLVFVAFVANICDLAAPLWETRRKPR